jgi:putative phosphoribosyl transferase
MRVFDTQKAKAELGVPVEIPIDGERARGDLMLEEGSSGLVLFAYGSGSSRFSPRQRFVSRRLNEAGLSTLFMDLLTPGEEAIDEETREFRFNIPLLAERLDAAIRWTRNNERTRHLKMGLMGGSTGASACLIAAAYRPSSVSAVVSRGGRTDLADEVLPGITAATLFIVGSLDKEVQALNETSFKLLQCRDKKLEVVPGASHLFEERGKMKEVAQLARDWFQIHLV